MIQSSCDGVTVDSVYIILANEAPPKITHDIISQDCIRLALSFRYNRLLMSETISNSGSYLSFTAVSDSIQLPDCTND